MDASPEALTLTNTLLSVIRLQRHLGARSKEVQLHSGSSTENELIDCLKGLYIGSDLGGKEVVI